MAEEKQQLSLSDLGLEKEETPAVKAEKENANDTTSTRIWSRSKKNSFN